MRHLTACASATAFARSLCITSFCIILYSTAHLTVRFLTRRASSARSRCSTPKRNRASPPSTPPRKAALHGPGPPLSARPSLASESMIFKRSGADPAEEIPVTVVRLTVQRELKHRRRVIPTQSSTGGMCHTARSWEITTPSHSQLLERTSPAQAPRPREGS